MATNERIAVEVTDSVASTITPKIKAIGDQARKAYDQLTRLQSQLNKLNASGLSKYQASLDKGTNAVQRQAIAAERLAQQQAKTAAATARAEVAQARLAAQNERTSAASQRLALASEKVATQQQRTASAAAAAATAQARAAAAEASAAAAKSRSEQAATNAAIAQEKLNKAALQSVSAFNQAQASESKAAIASQSLATAQQRTQQATLRTAAAQQNLNAAQSKAVASSLSITTAQQKLAAAMAQSTVATHKSAQAAAQAQMAQQRAAAQAQAAAAAQQIAQNNIAASAARAQAAQQRLVQTQNRVNQANQALNQTQRNVNRGLTSGGLTWKMYENSLRGVPAQITDIVVSLQGGQKPLTVLLQQGGQLKDMFGGIVPAAKALGSVVLKYIVNPWVLAASAVAALGYAFYQFEQRARTLNGQLAQLAATGRSGNINSGFLKDLRQQLEDLRGVSRDSANAIIQSFVEVRTMTASQMGEAAKIVGDLGVALGTTTPKAAEELAKAFEKPLQGAIKLDRQLGFLTTADFKAIDALEKHGKSAQANEIILKRLTERVKGLEDEAATPLQKAFTRLGVAWNNLKRAMESSTFLERLATVFIAIVDAITWVINKFTELTKTLDSWQPPAWVTGLMKVGKQIVNPIGGLLDQVPGTPNVANVAPRGNAATNMDTDRKLRDAGIKHDKTDKTAEKRAAALRKVNMELDNEIKLMGMLGPEREKQQKFDQIEETLAGKRITLTKAESAAIKEKIATIVEQARVQAEMDRMYDEIKGPQMTYNAALEAANKLLEKGAISQEEYNRQNQMTQDNYERAVDPLKEWNENLLQQFQLTTAVGDATEILSQTQQVENMLREKGIFLSGNQVKLMGEQLTYLQYLQQRQSAYNALWQEGAGAQKNINIQTEALNMALNNGVVSLEQYTIKANALKTAQAELNMQMGNASFADVAIAALGRVNDSYKGVLQGLSTSFASFFETITDGFANSLGRAIVYSEDLGSALQDVAKQAVSQLISALIKLGIQWAINQALGQSMAASSTAASAAMATGVASAWAPAAAAVSLASFGENSIPAMAGITATHALSKAMSAIPGFMDGGWTGNMPTNEIAGVVHGQEMVMNARTTSRNRALLEAIQEGSLSEDSILNGHTSNTGGTQMNVNIENNAPGVDFEVNQLSETDVEIIARRVVRKETDRTVASSFNNPNSKTMRSMQKNTKTRRSL